MSSRITLRQLQAFIAVAQAQSFTRAAERLNLAQPIVSGLVRDLEAEVGFRLFNRTTRRVEPTDAALEFLHDVERINDNVEMALRRARDIGLRRRGHIAVGAPPLLAAALMPHAMADFAQHSPDITVTLVDRPIADLHQMLKDGELHLAIGTFLRVDPSITRRSLVTDSFSLLCRTDHPLAALKRPRWRDLEGHALIALRGGNGIREQLERGYAAAGLTAEPAHEFSQLATVIAMVEAGFGLTVLPLYGLTALPSDQLIARPLNSPSLKRDFDVVHRADRTLSPGALAFIDSLGRAARDLKRQHTTAVTHD